MMAVFKPFEMIMLMEYGSAVADGDAMQVCIKAEPIAELVRCKDCKYRPHLRDAVDEDDAEELKLGHFNGFDLRFPTEWKCPCQVYDDEYYSWFPKDDWFCADGERREEP